jgi:hypothetical protein
MIRHTGEYESAKQYRMIICTRVARQANATYCDIMRNVSYSKTEIPHEIITTVALFWGRFKFKILSQGQLS